MLPPGRCAFLRKGSAFGVCLGRLAYAAVSFPRFWLVLRPALGPLAVAVVSLACLVSRLRHTSTDLIN